jgi:hypothetical protein
MDFRGRDGQQVLRPGQDRPAVPIALAIVQVIASAIGQGTAVAIVPGIAAAIGRARRIVPKVVVIAPKPVAEIAPSCQGGQSRRQRRARRSRRRSRRGNECVVG